MFRIIAWLKARFSRQPQREIFVYWDGARQRRIDPLVAWRGIWGHKEIDLARAVKISTNPTLADGKPVYSPEEIYAAEDQMRQLTREVFGVQQFSESAPGLTVAEIDALLSRFIEYMTDLKKKRKPLPMTPPPSVSSLPPLSTATIRPESPTLSPSESGSIASESSAAAPSGS